MLQPEEIDAKAEHLRHLLGTQLGAKADTFEAALQKAGRQLPARLRAKGQEIVEARMQVMHPKVALQIDTDKVTRACRDIEIYLEAIDPKDRRKGAVLGVLGSVAFNLIAVFTLLILFLVWQGFL